MLFHLLLILSTDPLPSFSTKIGLLIRHDDPYEEAWKRIVSYAENSFNVSILQQVLVYIRMLVTL